ncbi:restriction endonuclease subunit S [Prevotella sp. PINT]|nr:restriction endonuclease subunit S [Palleniella intestinalis]
MMTRLSLQACRTVIGGGYKYYRMSEIGSFTRGNGLQKKDFSKEGVGCIHYGQIYTRLGTFATKTLTKVPASLAKKLVKVQKGDIVITNTSENIEDVCKSVAWLGNEEIVIGGHACVFRHNQNPKYIAYWMQTADFAKQKRKAAQGVKVIDVKISDLEDFKIPIPPLAEQQRIVDILDRFEALTTDLRNGLPAELEARQQQYEYYRNKLLTFERATA